MAREYATLLGIYSKNSLKWIVYVGVLGAAAAARWVAYEATDQTPFGWGHLIGCGQYPYAVETAISTDASTMKIRSHWGGSSSSWKTISLT